MPHRREQEDILNPERAYFQMIRDYIDGRLTQPWLKLYRARVVRVGRYIGDLEENPPSPRNSIQARVYTDGLDYNLPDAALNIFYPMFPQHVSAPLEVGEHVYVVFEDENYSSGLWVTPIPGFSDINYGNPDDRESTQSDASQVHDPQPEGGQAASVNPSEEYGGISTNARGRQETVEAFPDLPESEENVWQGKKVMYIGDSMVGGSLRDEGPHAGRPQGIGPSVYELRNVLRDLGAAGLGVFGRVSWGVVHWLNGRFGGQNRHGLSNPQKKVSELIEEYDPDIILCTLGGNDAGAAGSRRDYPDLVERLWNEMQGGNVEFALWCGPPSIVLSPDGGYRGRNRTEEELARFNEDRDLVGRRIRRVVGDEHYIDCASFTRGLRNGRSPDGIHFRPTAPIGATWARAFIDKGNRLGQRND